MKMLRLPLRFPLSSHFRPLSRLSSIGPIRISKRELALLCALDGEPAEYAFNVNVRACDTIEDIKYLIASERRHTLYGVHAEDLAIWRVAIECNIRDDPSILLGDISHKKKKKLRSNTKVATAFPASLPDGTINILVQQHPEPLKLPDDQLLERMMDDPPLLHPFDLDFSDIPQFSEIESSPTLDLYIRKATTLIEDTLQGGSDWNIFSGDPTRAQLVNPFLMYAGSIFSHDLYLHRRRSITGRLPVNFAIRSRKSRDTIIIVTPVREGNFHRAVARNMANLEGTLTAQKRKAVDVIGKERKCYGVVTDSSQWIFLEGTIHENGRMSYRMSQLNEILNFQGNWREDSESVFPKIVWLWSRARDEIVEREKGLDWDDLSVRVRTV